MLNLAAVLSIMDLLILKTKCPFIQSDKQDPGNILSACG
ncbi:hypothetical protein CoNPh17_CDS0163 [Staphylococcus phage S-CoN_Ph17]|nr:hypothetical protein CoNPh17_CDS0163 [Staphylococcus phage S-CoN_Ph17]